MNVEVVNSVSTSANRQIISDIMEEVRNGAYRGRPSFDPAASGLQDGRIGYRGDDAFSRYDSEQNQNGEMDRSGEEADSTGYTEPYYGYNNFDELIEAIDSGAMIMTDDGRVLGENAQLSACTGDKTDRELLLDASNNGQKKRDISRRGLGNIAPAPSNDISLITIRQSFNPDDGSAQTSFADEHTVSRHYNAVKSPCSLHARS